MKSTIERAWKVIKLLETAGLIAHLGAEERQRAVAIMERILAKYAREVLATDRERIQDRIGPHLAEYREAAGMPRSSPLVHLLERGLREIIRGKAAGTNSGGVSSSPASV